MFSILDLPAELILHTLSFLDLADILACQLTHRLLYAIIKDSILLKYLNALKAAGMEDNHICPVENMSKWSRILNLQQDAWAGRLIAFSQKIPVPEDLEVNQYCGLHGGMCFFQYSNDGIMASSLHYVFLPSLVSDEIRWNCIDIVNVVAVGFAIYEHDLIAIATRSNDDEEWLESSEILLFEASTGNLHPLAENSEEILVPYTEMVIEIAGDHLVLLLGEDVEIYEWKTGILKMIIESATGYAYTSCIFLSSKVLLLTNQQNNTLEFWDIPELPVLEPTDSPRGALALPPIKDDVISHIWCHGQSFSKSYKQYSTLPLNPSLTDAIATFKINITDKEQFSDFTMFVHYQSLLRLCSIFPSIPPVSGESSTRACAIPWDKWGPPVTRLLGGSDQTVPLSAGANQRCVFKRGNSTAITVLDFNPVRIQRLNAVIPEHAESEKENVLRTSVITSESRLDNNCLQGCVASKLPYVQHTFQNTGTFQEFKIDNDRLIGIRYKQERIMEIEVLHIGQATAAE